MRLISSITAVAILVAMTGTAVASDTTAITVRSYVDGTCMVSSAPTINLNLDPSLTNDVSQSGNISLWCTKDTPFTVSDPGAGSTGTYNTVLSGNDARTTGKTIPLKISYTPGGTGAGKSTAISSGVTATVLNADFINAVAGSYTTQVTMTVSP